MNESSALIVKVFSGALSDYLGQRKGLAVFGYALGAFTKPLVAIASGSGLLIAARLIDRIGKGMAMSFLCESSLDNDVSIDLHQVNDRKIL